MKKLLSLLLAVLVCCAMFGCGGSESASIQDTSYDIDLSPFAARAYTLTMERERNFMPELGTEAAYAVEYTYADSENESLHLLMLRFDILNQINVNDNLYTPDNYYVIYDLDTDKIYDSEMMYAQIQGVLPNLTQRDEVLLWVLNRFSDEGRIGSIYQDGETLRILEDSELDAVNAKLADLNTASVEQGTQLLFDTVERFLANPPKGYTASGKLFHGVEYRNPDVNGTPVHCYLMDVRGEFRSNSAYATRVTLVLDAETGEIYSSLDPQYRKHSVDNPVNNFFGILKSYDISGIDTSEIYWSDSETIVPLYGAPEPLGPAMTQEALAAKVAEIVSVWLADSGDMIAESVYVENAAEVRCKAYSGFVVDAVVIRLEGIFRDSRKSEDVPPKETYIIGYDMSSGVICTLDETNAYFNTAPLNPNDMREVVFHGISGYQSYVRRDSSSVYMASEELIELEQLGIFTANKGFDHQIPAEKLEP